MFMRTELMTLYLTTFYRDENSVAATLCRYFRDYKVNPFVGSIEYNAWARAGSVNGYLQGSFCVSFLGRFIFEIS